MSNPDTPGPYWQEPADAGRRGTLNGPGREDPYGPEGGYGRPGGNGRANGNGAGNRLGQGKEG